MEKVLASFRGEKYLREQLGIRGRMTKLLVSRQMSKEEVNLLAKMMFVWRAENERGALGFLNWHYSVLPLRLLASIGCSAFPLDENDFQLFLRTLKKVLSTTAEVQGVNKDGEAVIRAGKILPFAVLKYPLRGENGKTEDYEGLIATADEPLLEEFVEPVFLPRH